LIGPNPPGLVPRVHSTTNEPKGKEKKEEASLIQKEYKERKGGYVRNYYRRYASTIL
jgi:hypothetical protein